MTVEGNVRVQQVAGKFLNLPKPLARFMCTARSVGDASGGFIRHNWLFNPDSRREVVYVVVTEVTASVHVAAAADDQLFCYFNNAAWPDWKQVNVSATQYTIIAEQNGEYSAALTQANGRLVDPSKPVYLGQTAAGVATSVLYVGAQTNPTAAGYLYTSIAGYISPEPFVLPGSMAY